jgi:hypothetical protein
MELEWEFKLYSELGKKRYHMMKTLNMGYRYMHPKSCPWRLGQDGVTIPDVFEPQAQHTVTIPCQGPAVYQRTA